MMITHKILVAEDELLVARVMKIILEKNNYTVSLVVDSISAIASVNEFNPDVIILDVFLKNNTNGIEAATEIRKNGFEGHIMFTTGNSFNETKANIKHIKNSSLFIKPVDTDLILNHLKSIFK